MSRFRLRWWLSCCAVLCAVPSLVYAYDSLFERVRMDRSLASVFKDTETQTDVQDGFLIGVGSERIKHLPDGRLAIERTRRYSAVRHEDTRAIAKFPEPWQASASVVLEPNLRLVSADTRLHFPRSGDTVFKDYKLSEKHAFLFEADRTLLRAVDHGRRLQLQVFKNHKLVKDETFDYPAHAAPLEVIGLYLSVAVQRGVDQFDFDLLVPDGSVHGVQSKITHTRDLRRFAKGYRVPKEHLTTAKPVAVVDLRLASPIKYLFFPHHFYMTFSEEQPDQLMMMWGGDPDTNLQAFRRD